MRTACVLIVAGLLSGCAEPILVQTREDLAKNIGRKVAVIGTYDVNENGEHVHNAAIDVMLDPPPDILGFGVSPVQGGQSIRAAGTLERGAMQLGVFIDEDTLSHSRGRPDQQVVPGYVLRDAKITRLKSPQPSPAKP